MASIQSLRIHGDNILECESALKLLASSLNGGHFVLTGGSAYSPIYSFESNTKQEFSVQLFPGYGRWNFPLVEYIASLGGTLREAPDAIITHLEVEGDKLYERPVLALEFSGALPAGNNAWQRTGRALALAYAGIPYLYFAELGGQELDAKRVIKAARFPNPLVPFAYAVLGVTGNAISLPIYLPSPSINEKIVEIYKDCFGDKESIELVRAILLDEDFSGSKSRIEKKIAKILEVLSGQRKKADILKPGEWVELYSQKGGLLKANWLIKKAMPWNKKTGIKTLTPTFKQVLKIASTVKAAAIGSRDMPICIISPENRALFGSELKKVYKDKIDISFQNWMSNNSRPLICVWVAGFKPRGDDSRPDRGLVPMARMIFGLEDVDLVTVVYGPAKQSTWAMLESNMQKLVATNGLWEAIVNLSDALIVDSSTSQKLKRYGFLIPKSKKSFEKKLLPAASDIPHFGEHDVDSVLHLLFSNAFKYGVYESMCNPPGGDWSGINIVDFEKRKEFRWTSLPRVSGLMSKRPDSLVQFRFSNNLLSIESKDIEARLENKIGPRLINYVRILLNETPIAYRNIGSNQWTQYKDKKLPDFNFFSGTAFKFQGHSGLKASLKRGNIDIAFGVEFLGESKKVILHVVTSKRGEELLPIIIKLTERLGEIIKLQLHKS